MKDKIQWGWVLAALVIELFITCSFSSCNIERFFSRQRSDSTTVAKTQSEKKDSTTAGSVSTTNSKSKEDYEWWRVILENMPKKDTNVTVNNIYPAPARVIYEGGTGTRQEETQSKDSAWMYQLIYLFKESMDSTNKRLDNIEKQSQTETKGVGIFALILVVGGAVVFLKLLNYIGRNYKLSKNKS